MQSEEIYFSKKFRNSVATYRYTLKNKIDKYYDCLAEIDEFLEQKGTPNTYN